MYWSGNGHDVPGAGNSYLGREYIETLQVSHPFHRSFKLCRRTAHAITSLCTYAGVEPLSATSYFSGIHCLKPRGIEGHQVYS